MNKIEIRDIRNGDWYWIHKIIYEKHIQKIGTIGLSLYNALCYYSNESGESFPSIEKIAEKLSITAPTVYKYLKILEDNKLLRIENRKKENKSNLYYLLKLLKEVDTPPKTALGGTRAHLLKEFNTNNNIYNNNILRISKESKKPSFGNVEINYLVLTFKEKTKLKRLGESEERQRQFSRHLLNKYSMNDIFNGMDWLMADEFWSTHLSKLSQLYYQMPRYLRDTNEQVEVPSYAK